MAAAQGNSYAQYFLDRQEQILVCRISSICLGQLPVKTQTEAALDYAIEMAASAAEPVLAMLSDASEAEAYQIFMQDDGE